MHGIIHIYYIYIYIYTDEEDPDEEEGPDEGPIFCQLTYMM